MKAVFLKVSLGFLGILLLADLIFLNWQAYKLGKISPEKPAEIQILTSTPVPLTEICPQSCLETIYEATVNIGTEPLSLPTPTTPSKTSQVKEFYVPLGAGSTTATSWIDIPGAEAYINPTNYGKIKSVTFEASLRIPSGSGRVYARLYNVNDKIGIFESEVWAEGSSGIRVESSKINLSSGNKLYRVQLKTTMGTEGDLDTGRVKIIVE